MAIKFYFDTHIAKVAAEQLRAKAITVIRCEEVDMASASDEEHLQYATDNGYIMVSQDADFLILNAEWQQKEVWHSGIMYEPKHLQGLAQVSHIVTELSFYYEAEQVDAINYDLEIANQVIYL